MNPASPNPTTTSIGASLTSPLAGTQADNQHDGEGDLRGPMADEEGESRNGSRKREPPLRADWSTLDLGCVAFGPARSER